MQEPALDHDARERFGFLGPAPTFDDLRASEARIILARWIAAPWIFAQIVLYSTSPYPPGVRPPALVLASVFPLGNLVIWAVSRRVRTREQARALALMSLAFDVVVASGFVWIYAFDQVSALWAVLFIVPLEGAIRFGLPGALGSWAAVAVLYTGREVWGSGRYDYPLEIESITFRMGIGLLIALVAGLTARDLRRQRARLAEALDELRRVDILRSTLVSTLAHDVRNPLAAVRTALQTLIARERTLSTENRTELLRVADRQARRLERLATDLLDLARMERGTLTLDLQDVRLRAAVHSALSYVEGGGGVDVRVPETLTVRANPARLEQIIVNIASNAVTYGEPPFSIDASSTDSWVSVEFRDCGPGVAGEVLPMLFEPVRASQHRTSVGLGLAIVKGLVEAHGGRIAYRANQPRGACFRVDLPAASSERAGASGSETVS